MKVNNLNIDHDRSFSDYTIRYSTTSTSEKKTSDMINKKSSIKLNDDKKQINSKRKVVVTKHLTKPCPKYYTDLFHTIIVICNDPEHKAIPNKKDLD